MARADGTERRPPAAGRPAPRRRRAVAWRRVPVGALLAAAVSLAGAGSPLGPVPLTAQTALRGQVVDEDSGEGVSEAELTLLDVEGDELGRALSDADGWFFFSLPAPGTYRLIVERIGYGRIPSQPFQVTRPDTIPVEFYVSQEAILLDPVLVRVGYYRGADLFSERLARGEGVLFGPEAVDSLRPSTHVGEILKHADAVRVRWGWGRSESGETGPMPRVQTYRGKFGCVNYMVDRTPVPAPFVRGALEHGPWAVAPLSELEPDDLVAVEVYRDWSEVPDDFRKQVEATNAQQRKALRDIQRKTCGLVIFWTEEGW